LTGKKKKKKNLVPDLGNGTKGGCEYYAMAVHRFLQNAPRIFGIDFGKIKLVGLGHSLGANAL